MSGFSYQIEAKNLRTKSNSLGTWETTSFGQIIEALETVKSFQVHNLIELKDKRYPLQPMTAAWLDSKVENGVFSVSLGESSDVMFPLRFLSCEVTNG